METRTGDSTVLKVIGVALTVIASLTGCVTHDQRPNTSSVPQRGDLHTRLGLAYVQEERLDPTQEELIFLLKLGPNTANAHHSMAFLMLKFGHRALILEHCERVITTDTGLGNGSVLCEAAAVGSRLGRPLCTRGFLERYVEQGNPISNRLLLAVNIERELGSDLSVQHYAYQLRTSYPDSLQAAESKQLISSVQGG